jgi:sugar lactone lactonase YvrE
VILTKDAAYFTDSCQPVLYKLPLGPNGELPAATSVQTIPLSGDFVFNPAAMNANGISLTPDGRGLIIVSAGLLYRVDPATGVTTKVDLGDATVANGDGLLLSGKTLYVVQNRLNQIAVLDLDKSGTKGELVRTITSTDFNVPTTAAFFGNRIYLPNAQLGAPVTEYWVTAVPR